MENSTLANYNKDSEISLKEIIIKLGDWRRYLVSKWMIILGIGIIGAIIGFTYAYFNKPIYTAKLSFALEDGSTGGLSGAAGLASQLGFDLGGGNGGGAFAGDNLLELMKSRSMVEKTLLSAITIQGKQQTLAELYISYNKFRSQWKNKVGLENVQFLPGADRSKFTLQQDSLLGVFYGTIVKKNLSVDKTDKKLSIITIEVNSENELFSKLFTETLAKTVSDFYIDTKTKKSVQNVAILQHQTDSVRRELNVAINGVASSIDAVPNANPGRQILRTPSQHKQVDVAADQAILTELVKNLEVSKVSLRKETPLIQVIDTPILPLEKTKAGKLKSIVLGGLLASFLTVLFLTSKKVYDNYML